MPEPAQVNRSLSTIRTELEYLRDSGVLHPEQLQSIVAQLPQQNGQPSNYIDPRYSSQPAQPPVSPQQIAQQAQDPNHPAHPNNPQHNEWAKNIASKFGNAMMWGAGATFGGDIVNDVMKHA